MNALDGDKLLAYLNSVVDHGMRVASDLGENGDEIGYTIASAGIQSARQIIDQIKSGDYTIEGK